MDPYVLPDLARRRAEAGSVSFDIVRVSGLRLPFFIGVHEFEEFRPQNVTIDVEMAVDPAVREGGGYVSYAPVADAALALSSAGEHIRLVETLADRLLDVALQDKRVAYARVTILKEDIYPQARGVGVTIERMQTPAEGAANG